MKVIVMTCNRNRWLIPVFLHFYKKYWPDNPYQIEIVTDSKRIRRRGEVFYARDPSWASTLIKYIKQSEENKFLIMLEDCLLNRMIETSRVKFAEELCEGNVGYVRLVNYPQIYFKRHTLKTNIKGFGEYPPGRRFGMVTQDAIYQKEFLLDVLRDGESIWETEGNGTKRVKELGDKWRILWPEINILDHPHRGILAKGELIKNVVQWALLDLVKEKQEA